MPDADRPYGELLEERTRQAQSQRDALLAAIEDMRLSRSLTFADDEHDPEGSTVSLDQARDTALLERVERTLDELGAARERLLAGRYGVCEGCGRAVPPDRLLVRPEARTCLPCSRSVGRRRH